MVKSMKKMRKHAPKKTLGKRNYRKTVKKERKKSRKNIKRVSLKKQRHSHKKHVRFYHSRGLHNSGKSFIGGKMKGGMVSSPAAGPVGYSWQGGNEATWPGVGATQNVDTNGATMSNHFSLSPNGTVVGGVELARSTSDDNNSSPSMNGGKKRRKMQKGGFFQEIINLGRGAQYGINGGYFDLIGKQQPLSQNPYPTEQPINSDSSALKGLASPPNVRQIFVNANNKVGKL